MTCGIQRATIIWNKNTNFDGLQSGIFLKYFCVNGKITWSDASFYLLWIITFVNSSNDSKTFSIQNLSTEVTLSHLLNLMSVEITRNFLIIGA